MRLEGKTAIVIGAGKSPGEGMGNGRAAALRFVQEGAKVLRAEQFPPPGYRVIRDTPVIGGQAAMSRGRALQMLALWLGAASALLCFLLWRFMRIFLKM